MTRPFRLSIVLILTLCFSASSNGAEDNYPEPRDYDATCVAFLKEGTTTSDVFNTDRLEGPIAFGYDENDAVAYRYPDVNTECVYRHGDARLHLSCTGHKMIHSGRPRNYTATYLYERSKSPARRGLGIRGEVGGLRPDTSFGCASRVEPQFIEASSRHEDVRYQTGYYVLPQDFLQVLELRAAPNGRFVVKATLTPVAATASLKTTTTTNEDRAKVSKKFRHGLIMRLPMSFFNYRLAYLLSNQLKVFKGQWPEFEDDLSKRINKTQRLVKTQLISEDDFYYLNQKSATYYHENTVPVWRSVAEGNWARVGRVMRDLAARTDSEFDLYATSSGNYLDANNNEPVMLAADNEPEGQQAALIVPKLLQRYMIDRKNPSRGIVYQVVNDPFMGQDEIEEWSRSRPKCRAIECHVRHPEFLDPSQGYTYCCEIKGATMTI